MQCIEEGFKARVGVGLADFWTLSSYSVLHPKLQTKKGVECKFAVGWDTSWGTLPFHSPLYPQETRRALWVGPSSPCFKDPRKTHFL